MVTPDAVMVALRTVPDPEMPISIVDLGLVESVRVEPTNGRSAVCIDLLPTFVGCPALDMIREGVESAVGALEGVDEVSVSFLHDPPWTVDRITEDGRASLRAFGVTVPAQGESVQVRTSAVSCPFCGSSETHLDSPFGPTRCRMIFYCDACRNPFEHMKKLEGEGTEARRHGAEGTKARRHEGTK